MPKRKDITEWLSKMVMRDMFKVPETKMSQYWAREVTLANKLYEPGKTIEIRPDFMKFAPMNTCTGSIEKGNFTVYEVKSCVADFKNDHGHNMVGDYNYYVMTRELYDKLHAEDKYDKFLRRDCMYHKAGVIVPSTPMKDGTYLPTDEKLLEFYDENDLSHMALFNPFTKQRDDSRLHIIIKPELNRRRLYSTNELLFAMLRSSQKDKIMYRNEYWKPEE